MQPVPIAVLLDSKRASGISQELFERILSTVDELNSVQKVTLLEKLVGRQAALDNSNGAGASLELMSEAQMAKLLEVIAEHLRCSGDKRLA